ncbi:MAG TPA: FtsQ-type POTRA domain-containing protein [Gaiellaceae bacterium]|nr:FtsQ-type POTRA domain-containing protein [Gaiellaceae bacterium]
MAKRRTEPRSRAAVAALPRRALGSLPLPSRRSLAIGLGLIALAGGAYAVARETSAFAIRHVEVVGGSPLLRAHVRKELVSLRGTNLLGLDGSALERRVAAMPAVVSATYDRSFPHTLRITIVPETPVAVLHRGTQTWLVSARARVIARLVPGARPLLPRIWVPTAAPVTVGDFLVPEYGGTAARTLGLVQHFPARIATATLAHDELTFALRSGVEIRFGAPMDIRLKLAIARRALRVLPAGTTYLDVSVPGRPVAGH